MKVEKETNVQPRSDCTIGPSEPKIKKNDILGSTVNALSENSLNNIDNALISSPQPQDFNWEYTSFISQMNASNIAKDKNEGNETPWTDLLKYGIEKMESLIHKDKFVELKNILSWLHNHARVIKKESKLLVCDSINKAEVKLPYILRNLEVKRAFDYNLRKEDCSNQVAESLRITKGDYKKDSLTINEFKKLLKNLLNEILQDLTAPKQHNIHHFRRILVSTPELIFFIQWLVIVVGNPKFVLNEESPENCVIGAIRDLISAYKCYLNEPDPSNDDLYTSKQEEFRSLVLKIVKNSPSSQIYHKLYSTAVEYAKRSESKNTVNFSCALFLCSFTLNSSTVYAQILAWSKNQRIHSNYKCVIVYDYLFRNLHTSSQILFTLHNL